MAESHLERAFRAMLKEEVRKLNQHLPKARKTLKTLLEEKTPSVDTIDGARIAMKLEELEMLAGILHPHLQERLQLPIVIRRRFDLGRSVYTVSGDELEEFVLKSLLGVAENDFSNYKAEQHFYIYKPYLAELIRKIHSLIVIGFGTPEGLAPEL
jgi:uncharacterized protein (UPF0216 family)